MAKNKRSPMVAEMIKGIVFLGFGVVLIVQPWLKAISWLGWLILVCGALIAGVMGLRIYNAKKMQKSVIAQFAGGNAVYEKGLKIAGVLYDFSTFGAEIRAASYDGVELRFQYSYYAKRNGRASETIGFAVDPQEVDLARRVLEHLGLPTIEEAEEARQDAADGGEAQKG